MSYKETKTINPNPPADFQPDRQPFTPLRPFRHWCQKVLPLVYDDSLSYYELLCKVVDYLNKTMEDVDNFNTDMTSLYDTYEQLHEYVNNYFSSLDVQTEINNKLDVMASDGSLSKLIQPLFDEYKEQIDSDIALFKETTNSDISNFKNTTTQTVNTQNSKIDVLEGRMDEFTKLPEGSTTGDAELIDIRVGYNGETYPEAGDAVRSQYGFLNDKIDSVSGKNLIKYYVNEVPDPILYAFKNSIYLFKNDEEKINGGDVLYLHIYEFRQPIDAIYIFEVNVDKYICKKIITTKSANNIYRIDLSEFDANLEFVIGFYSTKDESIGYGSSENYYLYESTQQYEEILNLNENVTFKNVGHAKFAFSADVMLFKAYKNEYVKRQAKIGDSVLYVSKDDIGNFNTINDAMTFADQYMNKEKPVTIVIYPGVYEEVVNVKGKRNLSIVGINRDRCIIRDDTGIYNNCPLRIEGNSYVANLTLISTHKNDSEFVIDGIVQKLPSYGLHIDDRHDNDDDEYVCTVYNCKIYSEQNPAVGIGLDKNQTVNIFNCEVITNKTDDVLNATGAVEGNWAYKPSGGALFYHALYSGSYDNDNGYQRLNVKDCIIKNNDKNAVFGEAGGMEEQVTLTFVGNSGWSDKNGATAVMGLTRAKISEWSFGNNIADLNHNE